MYARQFELAIFLVVIGLILIAFSKSKKEDELMAKVRLNSLYWSVVIYYVIYNFGFLLINFFKEIPFISEHLFELNIFTPLLIFIVRFYYLRYAKSDLFLVNEPKFLPNQPFRWIGITLTIMGLAVLIPSIIKDALFFSSELVVDGAYFTMVTGLLIWAFSKNKTEDEMVMQQRLESLQAAVYFNYGVLLVATLLVYSFNYLLVLMFSQVSLLLYFVIRMEYIRYKTNN